MSLYSDRDVIHEYFCWMYSLVCDDTYTNNLSYRKLFMALYSRRFTFILPMDESREKDGLALRMRFEAEQGFEGAYQKLAPFPCSVLEMMVALALKCEENIMSNYSEGNRTSQWFWTMIVNLGLNHMNDGNFDKDYVDSVIDNLLDRRYEKDGTGGLFKTSNPEVDMRTTDIWYQMCYYLLEIVDEKTLA